jgi:hypothetical protein
MLMLSLVSNVYIVAQQSLSLKRALPEEGKSSPSTCKSWSSRKLEETVKIYI